MAYAPHNNTDVQHQMRMGIIPTRDPLLLGSFRFDNAKGPLYEYAERRWPCDEIAPSFPHIIYTIDGPRLARVLHTVAHVIVDETPEGLPQIERWPLACHKVYPTDWVKA